MPPSVSNPPELNHPFSTFERITAHLLDSEINAISGAVAGVASALAVCPLDVAKTKLQAQGGFLALQKHYINHTKTLDPAFLYTDPPISSESPPPSAIEKSNANLAKENFKYKGIFGTLSTIFKEEGIAGLYRGVVPITIGYLPTWAIYFVIYEEVKKRTSKSLGSYPFFSHMVSALSAGAVSTLCTNPIWVVKTRLMTQSPTRYKYVGTLDCFRKMYMDEGLISFYAGLGPALLGLLHVAVQFPLYEFLKTIFHVDDDLPKLHQGPQILASSVIAKICASTITYPHEVIRTRIQIQPTIMESEVAKNGPKKRNIALMKYHGIVNTTKTIFREEGWRAFYSGLGTNMVRTVPASAITILTYEIVAGYLKDRRHELSQMILSQQQ